MGSVAWMSLVVERKVVERKRSWVTASTRVKPGMQKEAISLSHIFKSLWTCSSFPQKGASLASHQSEEWWLLPVCCSLAVLARSFARPSWIFPRVSIASCEHPKQMLLLLPLPCLRNTVSYCKIYKMLRNVVFALWLWIRDLRLMLEDKLRVMRESETGRKTLYLHMPLGHGLHTSRVPWFK